jgi:hypothetical protein
VTFTAAYVREQGVEFTVVLVKPSANQPGRRERTMRELGSAFPGRLVIACSQDSRGVASYYGRRDIVTFLSNVLIEQLPWKEYRTT